jgi:6-pyruvoyl-tetrahydropterin synthase
MDQRNLNRILKRLEDQLQHAYSNKRNPTNYRDVYPTNPELKRWNNFLQRKENVMRDSMQLKCFTLGYCVQH